MEESPWAPAAEQTYLISGLTHEEFDLRGLRDRIRAGQLMPNEEIALVGTDIWKPAAQYPALARYFALAQKASAGAMVHPSATPAAPAEPIGSRIAAAFAYPFSGLTPIVFLVLGFATALNILLSALLSLLATVYCLAIIRSSGEGKKSAPPASAVGGAVDWILDLLRVIAISLISAWPIIAAVILFIFGMRSVALLFAAAIVMLLYYPACLVAVAQWKSLLMALSVKKIFGLISTLGSDYYAAIAMTVLLFIVFGALASVSQAVIGTLAARGVNVVATVFTTFYSAHLLGWAVYRHRADL